MTINRRDFLKAMAGGAVAATVAMPAVAREPLKIPADAVGMLFDSALCIGCRACMTACKTVNDLPADLNPLWNKVEFENGAAQLKKNPEPNAFWDAPYDLNGNTYNIIRMYKTGAGNEKDMDSPNGFAFMKFSCLHCVDPSCVSCCPVSAMKKDPLSGIVSYDKEACIGCRYCVAACPFHVPRFEYDQAFPKISKCQLCKQRIPDGKYAACSEVCPTGATLYGKVADLKREVQRRKALKPGQETVFPRGRIDADLKSPDTYIGMAPKYIEQVYGEKENGGTQVIRLSSIPFEKLGLSKVPAHPASATSEGGQAIYSYLALPLVVFGGLTYLAKRNIDDGDDQGGSHE